MMRKVLVVVLLFCSVSMMGAQARKTRKARKPGPVTPATLQPANVPDKAFMQQILDSWQSLNPEQAAKYYAKDPDLVFYDVENVKYLGWAAYAKGIRDGWGKDFQSMKATVNDDARVWVEGNRALGAATVQLQPTKKDGSLETPETVRWTVVWEKRRTEWIIIHEHMSVSMYTVTKPMVGMP